MKNGNIPITMQPPESRTSKQQVTQADEGFLGVEIPELAGVKTPFYTDRYGKPLTPTKVVDVTTLFGIKEKGFEARFFYYPGDFYGRRVILQRSWPEGESTRMTTRPFDLDDKSLSPDSPGIQEAARAMGIEEQVIYEALFANRPQPKSPE